MLDIPASKLAVPVPYICVYGAMDHTFFGAHISLGGSAAIPQGA